MLSRRLGEERERVESQYKMTSSGRKHFGGNFEASHSGLATFSSKLPHT